MHQSDAQTTVHTGQPTSQNVCFNTVFSGDVYIAPIIVPMEPAKLIPSTTQGLADIMRKAKPFLNIVRATSAVMARPPPVYWKLSCRYDRSAWESASRVSRLRKVLTPTIVPATATYEKSQIDVRTIWNEQTARTAVIPYRFHASCCVGLYTTGFASVRNVREWPENLVRKKGEALSEERVLGRRLL